MSDAKALSDVKISFFFGLSSCYYFNLIAFIISVETEASLLALAKSIYFFVTSYFNSTRNEFH